VESELAGACCTSNSLISQQSRLYLLAIYRQYSSLERLETQRARIDFYVEGIAKRCKESKF
jgi:hypothetical protein